jgi:hypothetical protein
MVISTRILYSSHVIPTHTICPYLRVYIFNQRFLSDDTHIVFVKYGSWNRNKNLLLKIIINFGVKMQLWHVILYVVSLRNFSSFECASTGYKQYKILPVGESSISSSSFVIFMIITCWKISDVVTGLWVHFVQTHCLHFCTELSEIFTC